MDMPSLIICCLCGAALFLIIIRIAISFFSRPQPGPDMGGAMTIGDREVQEDCYGMLGTTVGQLLVLADGMGQAYGGKIASKIAVETFTDIFREYNAFDNPQYYFRKAFHAANQAILRELGDERRGAASVACGMVRDGKFYYAAVGNVRVCVFRGQDLVPMSSGHTLDVLAKESFQVGKLSRQDAITMLENHRLYNYVGQDGFHEVELFDRPVSLQKGDVVVLMTDGLYDLVPWRQIETILSAPMDAQKTAYTIIDQVNQSKEENKDNAGVVLLRVGNEAPV